MIQSILAHNDHNDNDSDDSDDSDDDNKDGGDYILHQDKPNNSQPRVLSRNGGLGQSLTPSLSLR